MLLLWSSIIAGIGELVLAGLVLVKSRKKSENYFFAALSFLLGLVAIFNYLSLSYPNSEITTLFWIRTVMFVVPYLMLFVYYFGRSYLNKNFSYNRIYFWILFVASTIVAFVNYTPFVYKSVELAENGQIIPETGPGIAINALLILPFFSLSIYHMVKNARSSSKEKASKIRYALYFFLISFGVQIVTSFVIVALFNYTRLVFLGNFLTLFFATAITFSILKFRMFTINIISSIVFAVIMVVLMFAEIFTVANGQELAYRIIVFIAVAFVAYQFVQSIRVENKQKKELESLTNKLKEANQRLKKLDAMKTEFVSVASHELLTPISAIKGYLSMILDEKIVDIKNAKAEDYLDRVYMSAKRLSKLVKDLLNVSRIEQGRLSFKKKKFDPNKLMDSVKKELKFKAEDENTDIKIVGEIDQKAYGDTDKLKEVLINLVGNSIKFTLKDGKIEMKAEVWDASEIKKRHKKATDFGEETKEQDQDYLPVHVRDVDIVGDKQVVFSVKDNGIGMEEGDMKKLFGKFSRLDNWQQHHIQGTGLGLYISKTLILMHYGRIWAESKGKDKGSTFFFSVPLEGDKEKIDKLDEYIPQTKDAKPLAKINKEEM